MIVGAGTGIGRSLMQEQDVRGHIGASVPAEGGVGQSDGTQQDRVLGEVPTDGVVLLVHGVATGNERHHAAGANDIEGLAEKVVVDRAREMRGAAVGRIKNRIVSE